MFVVHVGRGYRRAVHQAGTTVHADMHLHAEVPLWALAGLVHVGSAGLAGVLRRAWRTDDRGVDDGSRADLQTPVLQTLVDLCEQRRAQFVLLQQTAKL